MAPQAKKFLDCTGDFHIFSRACAAPVLSGIRYVRGPTGGGAGGVCGDGAVNNSSGWHDAFATAFGPVGRSRRSRYDTR